MNGLQHSLNPIRNAGIGQPAKSNAILMPSLTGPTSSKAGEALLAPFPHVEIKLLVTAATAVSDRESV